MKYNTGSSLPGSPYFCVMAGMFGQALKQAIVTMRFGSSTKVLAKRMLLKDFKVHGRSPGCAAALPFWRSALPEQSQSRPSWAAVTSWTPADQWCHHRSCRHICTIQQRLTFFCTGQSLLDQSRCGVLSLLQTMIRSRQLPMGDKVWPCCCRVAGDWPPTWNFDQVSEQALVSLSRIMDSCFTQDRPGRCCRRKLCFCCPDALQQFIFASGAFLHRRTVTASLLCNRSKVVCYRLPLHFLCNICF